MIIIGLGLPGGAKFGLFGVECVAIFVVGAANGVIGGHRINHKHGVVGAIDIGVNSQAE